MTVFLICLKIKIFKFNKKAFVCLAYFSVCKQDVELGESLRDELQSNYTY